MIVPNLASRVRLNSRPVWILTIVAGSIALVLTVVNIRMYLASNQALAELIVRRDALQAQQLALTEELGGHVEVLERVPWRSLGIRVNAVNKVLVEHQFSWTLLLDHLGEVLPWQVRLVSITPSVSDGKAELAVTAVSQDREGFLNFLDRLVADPHFLEPIPSAEEWPEGGMGVEYFFKMRIGYVAEGDSQ
ncbi:MAG: hypothetical protein K8R59_00900 [Thermoanaerobaculales bacterium]|nr:hypothetical protein [Thermoanaerobaculales bacterium]